MRKHVPEKLSPVVMRVKCLTDNCDWTLDLNAVLAWPTDRDGNIRCPEHVREYNRQARIEQAVDEAFERNTG